MRPPQNCKEQLCLLLLRKIHSKIISAVSVSVMKCIVNPEIKFLCLQCHLDERYFGVAIACLAMHLQEMHPNSLNCDMFKPFCSHIGCSVEFFAVRLRIYTGL